MLTISKTEGVTVFTVHSNHRSKWPLICQILGTVCYSPVCSVSQRLKQQLGCAMTTLATIQIMIGIMNLGFGSLTSIYGISYLCNLLLWLGGTITLIGMMCILAEKFPSPCVVVLSVVMNLVSSALAITTIVLYSVYFGLRPMYDRCQFPDRQEVSRYYWKTTSPSKEALQDEMYEKKLEDYKSCQENELIMQKLLVGVDILMIVLAVLHLCVSISWCALSIKALCKKQAEAEDVEDPELRKPLMKQENPDPVC